MSEPKEPLPVSMSVIFFILAVCAYLVLIVHPQLGDLDYAPFRQPLFIAEVAGLAYAFWTFVHRLPARFWYREGEEHRGHPTWLILTMAPLCSASAVHLLNQIRLFTSQPREAIVLRKVMSARGRDLFPTRPRTGKFADFICTVELPDRRFSPLTAEIPCESWYGITPRTSSLSYVIHTGLSLIRYAEVKNVGGGNTGDLVGEICDPRSRSAGSDGQVCLHRDSQRIWMSNSKPTAVTLSFEYETGATPTASDVLPSPMVVPAHGETEIFRPPPKFQFRWFWQLGDFRSVVDDAFVYELPYLPNEAYTFGQGPQGRDTHGNSAAYDFNFPEGSSVAAARAGRVIYTQDELTVGNSEDPSRPGNEVRVLHEDGSIARYYHLKKGGVAVQLGDRVRPGQVVGLSGNTGYTFGPHLHFDVGLPIDGRQYETRAVTFRTDEGNLSQMREGRTYRRPALLEQN